MHFVREKTFCWVSYGKEKTRERYFPKLFIHCTILLSLCLYVYVCLVYFFYKKKKLEESLLMAMEETGNKTIYALRQDQQLLQYQLVPAASPMKMNVDEVSLVPLGNSSIGNFMQADGTILPESTSLPAAASSTSSAAETGAIVVSPSSILNTVSAAASAGVAALAKNDEEKKQKAQQNMQDTKKNVSSVATTSATVVEKGASSSSSYVSSCLRTISPGKNIHFFL